MKSSRAIIIHGIEVRGRVAFRRATHDALNRLHPLPEFDLIQARLAVIRQGRRSGMEAWAPRPTFVVGEPTWSHSALWYAGAIAHDAYHAELYRAAKEKGGGAEPAPGAWTGSEAEKRCLAFQRGVLAELGAGENLLAYIDQCARAPVYQGRAHGWKRWLDYFRRRW